MCRSAIASARRAVAARHADADEPGEIEALVALAQFQSRQESWASAAKTLAVALPLAHRQGEPADEVRLLLLTADVERRANHISRSQSLFDDAGRVAERADNGALKRMVAEARLRASQAEPARRPR